MKTPIRTLLTLAVLGAATFALAQTDDTLRIYLVDVEGGNATLFVSPSGESMLMDTGNGGANADRDVGRIMAAVGDAGLRQIDHLITTHWHGDHYGGLAELATRIPHRALHRPRADGRRPRAGAGFHRWPVSRPVWRRPTHGRDARRPGAARRCRGAGHGLGRPSARASASRRG